MLECKAHALQEQAEAAAGQIHTGGMSQGEEEDAQRVAAGQAQAGGGLRTGFGLWNARRAGAGPGAGAGGGQALVLPQQPAQPLELTAGELVVTSAFSKMVSRAWGKVEGQWGAGGQACGVSRVRKLAVTGAFSKMVSEGSGGEGGGKGERPQECEEQGRAGNDECAQQDGERGEGGEGWAGVVGGAGERGAGACAACGTRCFQIICPLLLLQVEPPALPATPLTRATHFLTHTSVHTLHVSAAAGCIACDACNACNTHFHTHFCPHLHTCLLLQVASTVTYPHEVLRSYMHVSGSGPIQGLKDACRCGSGQGREGEKQAN